MQRQDRSMMRHLSVSLAHAGQHGTRVPLSFRVCLQSNAPHLEKHLFLAVSLHPVCQPVGFNVQSLTEYCSNSRWISLRGDPLALDLVVVQYLPYHKRNRNPSSSFRQNRWLRLSTIAKIVKNRSPDQFLTINHLTKTSEKSSNFFSTPPNLRAETR